MKLNKALDLMRERKSALVKMNTQRASTGVTWYLIPGGEVSEAIAEKIIRQPNVRANKDGLFPGHDQTWRMI